jgi:hypothetical protein
MPLLWFASSTSGNATIPAAALGQADGTYTANSGGSDWTHRWAFAPFERPLDPDTNAPLVLHMTRSAAANNPTLEVVRYYDGASLLGSYTLDLAINSDNWTHEISLPAGDMSGIVDHLAVEIQTVGHKQGNPAGRSSAQLDAVSVDVTYEEFKGSQFQGWGGSQWQTGKLKRWDGSTWSPAAVQRFDGSDWVEVP